MPHPDTCSCQTCILERQSRIGTRSPDGAWLYTKNFKISSCYEHTGWESHHASSYFVKRRASCSKFWQKITYRTFPKAGVLCDARTHLILAIVPGRGPGPDIKHFRRALDEALSRQPIDVLVADAGYDAEHVHEYAREECGVNTFIPSLIGRPTAKKPAGFWRRRMANHLSRSRYTQRWQVETVNSMLKRLMGSALRAIEHDKPLNPRQRKLIPLLFQYEEGKITLEEALKQAGYADSTARQQSTVPNPLRQNSAMQAALRAAGFDEETIAKKIVEGLDATLPTVVDKVIEDVPDSDSQHKYLKTGAELLDAFPAKKNINTDVSLDELIKAAESSTPNEDSRP